jgi:regulatory protein
MQIIAVRKIKNNVQVVFNTGEELLIKPEVFLKSGLRINDFMDEVKVQELLNQNKIFLAKQTALNILSRRDHSKKELERKLYQRKVEKDITGEIISELIELKYLDDERFAKAYLEEKLKLKNVGIEKVKRELFAKGVSREIIKSILDEKGEIDESESAYSLVMKKMKQFTRKTQDTRKIKQKIYTFLFSKGYDYETIEQVFNKINFDFKTEQNKNFY